MDCGAGTTFRGIFYDANAFHDSLAEGEMELFSQLILFFILFGMLYAAGQLLYMVLVVRLFRIMMMVILIASGLSVLFARPNEALVLAGIALPFLLNLTSELTAIKLWQGAGKSMNYMWTALRYRHENISKQRASDDDAARQRETKTRQKQEENPYQILQIPPSATKEEIKKAYHSMMKHYHPDRYHGAPGDILSYVEEKSKVINHAYEKLMAR